MHLVPNSRDLTYPVSEACDGDRAKLTSSPTFGKKKGALQRNGLLKGKGAVTVALATIATVAGNLAMVSVM